MIHVRGNDRKKVVTLNDSILDTIKQLMGITVDYEHFDSQLITHINSVLMILTQLGVGPPDGFIIHDRTDTWSEFLTTDKNLELVKSYIHLKVKLLFDPPLSSVVTDCLTRMISEYEWRLNTEVEYNKEVSQNG